MGYKPEELKRVQEIEVEILQEIIRVCEEYKLQYWVAYGTLIGTLRHNGFIPWDDDIDIGMMREDYEKFIEVAPSALKKAIHFSISKQILRHLPIMQKFVKTELNLLNGTHET